MIELGAPIGDNGVGRSSSARSLAWSVYLLPARLRALFYRCTAPLLFRSLGRDSHVFGSLHIAFPLSDIRVGRGTMLGPGTFWQVSRRGSVRIGDRFSINRHSLIVIGSSLVIGDNVAVGEFVSIRDQEHRFSPGDAGVVGAGFRTAPIVIEDNCWIGRGVYIGPGSHIRRGSIVAANSVVRGEHPPHCLIAGAPATVRKLFADREEALEARHSV